MELGQIIILIGPKHSGKTLAGRALARIMSLDFLDLDEAVEMETRKSPRTLYKEGPEIFKKAESSALAHILSQKKGIILAAGGGLVDNQEALILLKDNPHVMLVYLEVSADTAWRRILSAGEELPPFLNTANPRETHSALHIRRAREYKTLARFCIDGENKEIEDLANEIAEKIEA